MENKTSLTYRNMVEMDVRELNSYIEEYYIVKVPSEIDTPKGMKEASEALVRANAYNSYFTNKAMDMKILKRKLKREKAPAELIEDALTREEIFTKTAELAKFAYNTVSRLITIKQEMNYELRMTNAM